MPTPEVRRARELVLRYGWNAMAYQILNPGMRLWFPADGEGVAGYVHAGNYRVIAGSPVCAPERLAEVAAELGEDTRRHGRRLCYFGAQDRLIALLAERGPASALLLGAQPSWDPRRWPAVVAAKASLRAQLARARNKGVAVRRSPSSQEPGLQGCLNEWIERRGLPPMHFLVEWNLLPRLLDRRLYVAERAGRTVGFLIASPIPRRDGWLIEQIIRGRAAPNGTTELLLDSAVRALAADGAEYVTLGLSPLSQAAPPAPGVPEPPWSVRLLLASMRAQARRYYNFEGLERFKRKFVPERWEPIYAVTDRPRVSLRTLYAIAGAFGGRSPILFAGHALLRALAQEARWARRTLTSGKNRSDPSSAAGSRAGASATPPGRGGRSSGSPCG
jgi:phosphatidylglycerol lysyltransferase